MVNVIKKKVNVRAHTPITNLKYPIAGVANGISLTLDEILVCIRGNAKVEEVIGFNKTVPLDFANYDKNNSIQEIVAEIEPAKIMNVKEVGGKLIIEAATEPVDTTPAVKAIVPEPVQEVLPPTETVEADKIADEEVKVDAAIDTVEAEVKAPVYNKYKRN